MSKEVLRKLGRCYACLKKGHISCNCRSTESCNTCHGSHHNTVCPRWIESTTNPSTTSPGPITEGQEGANQVSGGTHRPTNVAYVDSQTLVLLQTARLQLYNPNVTTAPSSCVEARAIMDSRSQRTYDTNCLRECLHLPTKTNKIFAHQDLWVHLRTQCHL